MSFPFDYPAEPLARLHGPRGYEDYESYRPWLRDDFAFRCVYCLRRERWSAPAGALEIDHFLPVAHNREKTTEYDNLYYCCGSCNKAKRDLLLPIPTQTLLRETIQIESDGTLISLTPDSERIVELLGLNSPKYVEFRLLWIGIVNMAQLHSHDLFIRLMGYPEDIPDLALLRPPAGNARPNGIAQSHFQRRLRGELTETY